MKKNIKQYWNWYMGLDLLSTIGFTVIAISITTLMTIILIIAAVIISYMFY